MAKYIKAEALIDDLRDLAEANKGTYHEEGFKNAMTVVEMQPSADVRENVHAHFIGTEYDGYADGYPVFYEWKCSNCGCIFEDEEPTMEEYMYGQEGSEEDGSL